MVALPSSVSRHQQHDERDETIAWEGDTLMCLRLPLSSFPAPLALELRQHPNNCHQSVCSGRLFVLCGGIRTRTMMLAAARCQSNLRWHLPSFYTCIGAVACRSASARFSSASQTLAGSELLMPHGSGSGSGIDRPHFFRSHLQTFHLDLFEPTLSFLLTKAVERTPVCCLSL